MKSSEGLLLMPLFYNSGEQIMKGDHILLHGNPGQIEFVSDPTQDPNDWYVSQFGGGIMIAEPTLFGRLFLTPADSDYANLVFVSRA